MSPSIGLAEVGDLGVSEGMGKGVQVTSPGRTLFSGSPLAVGLPEGDVLYNSWKWHREIDQFEAPRDQGIETGDRMGRPSIRLVDPATGVDELLVDGAQSLAVSREGRVAYALGVDPDYRHNLRWLGDVFVRETVRAEATRWSNGTGEEELTVLAWAGDRLIVERQGEPGSGAGDLLAFDGPGKARQIATGLNLLAVSPDGEHLLVGTANSFLTDDTWELQLVEVATGRVRGLGDVTGGVMVFGASWAGDTIVAGGGSFVDGPGEHPRIVVLHAEATEPGWNLTREALIPVDRDRVYSPTDVWLAANGTEVVTVGKPLLPAPEGRVTHKPRLLIRCVIATGECTYDELSIMTNEQIGRLANPSRPAADDLTTERS